MSIKLRGLAEGIVGSSEVKVASFSDLLIQYPQLEQIKHKLTFSQDMITGFAACDG
jgi:hypothetical protein